MDMEFEKEKIGILKTEMNLLWSAVFITFGGSIAIIININFNWQLIIAAIGFLLSAIFANAFIMKRTEAVNLVNCLKGYKK